MEYPLCLCGGRDYKRYYYETLEAPITILACRRCHLARTWPPPLVGQGLNDYYEGRDDHQPRFEQLVLWTEFAKRTLRILKKYRDRGRLLDVGCNLGSFAAEALRVGYDAYGIDLSEKALAYGREKLGLSGRLSVGTVTEQRYADNSWDVITYIHCFEHLENPGEEMREAKRVLRPGGIILIEVPRFYSAWRFFLGKRWYGFSPFQHIWQCGKRGVVSILEREGLEIIDVKTRTSMYHRISFNFKGLLRLGLTCIAWLTGTGDNLFVIATKK